MGTEHGADRLCLGRVIGHGAGAVSIDVIEILRHEAGIGKASANRAGRALD